MWSLIRHAPSLSGKTHGQHATSHESWMEPLILGQLQHCAFPHGEIPPVLLPYCTIIYVGLVATDLAWLFHGSQGHNPFVNRTLAEHQKNML